MENHKSGIASQQGKKPDRQERRGRQTNLKGEGGWVAQSPSLPAAKIEGQGQSIVQLTTIAYSLENVKGLDAPFKMLEIVIKIRAHDPCRFHRKLPQWTLTELGRG